MVSKRQKLARRRLRETNPELFPQPEPKKADPNSKKSKRKAKSQTLKAKYNVNKTSGSKHPLRIPGMRPGENCFICKSTDHIAKFCPEKSQWEKNKICLLCRRRGHSLRNCPEKHEELERKFCYNCGDNGHALSNCPLPIQDGGTKFASCFICNERGHLSKNCPKNTHGIYPKGGCCKVCGGVTHLARDCPDKVNRNSSYSTGSLGKHEVAAQGKRTVFHGGDDLDDDFTVVEDEKKNTTDSLSNLESATKEVTVQKEVFTKSKKNQGPKVVNFFG